MIERPQQESELALGTAQWGMEYGVANRTGVPDRSSVRDMLALARESGVTQLDTARAYGQSEAAIGAATAGEACWTIVTKLAPDVFAPGHGPADATARTQRSLAQSRDALGRERLDVVLLHRREHRRAAGGAIWRCLARERERGGIRALGVSARNPSEAWSLLSDPEVEVIQVASSLLDQRLHRSGFFQRASELGRRVYVRSVFLQGVAHIAPDGLPRHLRAIAPALGRIRELASASGATTRDAFLSFARSLTGATVLVGCERPLQLLQILGDWQCSALDAERIGEIAAGVPKLDERLLDPSRWGELRRPPARRRRLVGPKAPPMTA